MSIFCRPVSLAQLPPNIRAHRRRWQMGNEVAIITYQEKTLGLIVSLEIFHGLPAQFVSPMPLRDLQPWLFQNRQGWIEGIMDGLTLTWQKQKILGFVHPRHSLLLPLAVTHL